MSEAARQSVPRLTWDDYKTWPDDERWEIVEGIAYGMSPGPAARHQRIVASLYLQMASHFKSRKCEVFLSPMDVKLSPFDVVQPDLLVVCDPSQVKPSHIEGPPTLVVEILSPSSHEHDRLRKTRLYARSGVREYWIVTPFPSSVEVLVLDGDSYRLKGLFAKEEDLVSCILPDLRIHLPDIFNFPLEPGEEPRTVREPPASRYATQSKKG